MAFANDIPDSESELEENTESALDLEDEDEEPGGTGDAGPYQEGAYPDDPEAD
jgi:hypothetical protein